MRGTRQLPAGKNPLDFVGLSALRWDGDKAWFHFIAAAVYNVVPSTVIYDEVDELEKQVLEEHPLRNVAWRVLATCRTLEGTPPPPLVARHSPPIASATCHPPAHHTRRLPSATQVATKATTSMGWRSTV